MCRALGRWRHRGPIAPQRGDGYGDGGDGAHRGPMAPQRGDSATEGRWRHMAMAPKRDDGATEGRWCHRGTMAPQRADGATDGRWRHRGPMAPRREYGCSERKAADQVFSFYPILTIMQLTMSNDCTANVIMHVAKYT